MSHKNEELARLLLGLDLGNSVAEIDGLLDVARVETSAFADLLADKVDLVPGTKGSGKSALFRIFVQFLPDLLLTNRKVVVAHGVEDPGDPVFNAFREEFERLDEGDFVGFWCIYLISLAHEQFIKGPRYSSRLQNARGEVATFREACAAAHIPEVQGPKTLRSILSWTLEALKTWRPKLKYSPPGHKGSFELDLFGSPSSPTSHASAPDGREIVPRYVNDVKVALEGVLRKTELSIWLMIDRLDEVFPRRSPLERTALRGLLRAMRIFSSAEIRVKVFLRDDMLEQVVAGGDGFVALTHVTARQADTLRWTPDQLLTMIVKRLFANEQLCSYLDVDLQRINASAKYREEAFYMVFPPKVHRGQNQSTTLQWLYTWCADGRRVVTPRDVLDLLIRAKQHQQDACLGNPGGTSDHMIGQSALRYGHEELSKRKRTTYLQAEFPHLWPYVERLIKGKAQYTPTALAKLFGDGWKNVVMDLVSVGVLAETRPQGSLSYSIPFVYRKGLEVTRGRA